MEAFNQSIILIGFKHVGKSTIGRELALKLALPFIDLDEEIEKTFADKEKKPQSCREIMQNYGERYFRDLEQVVLGQILQNPPSIIALGGGAPLKKSNQNLIKPYIVIHVKALRRLVFQRIMESGHPAFFSNKEPPSDVFIKLWNRRRRIYKKLATFTIENNHSIQEAVNQALEAFRDPSLRAAGEAIQ
jgi:shikimate kinase